MEQKLKQLYKPLFLYVKKRVKQVEDAEDLTQDIFLKLSRSNSDNIKSVKNWVFTIAKNTITDYYRKKKSITASVEDLHVEYQETDSDIGIELSECIIGFIDRLPEEYRSILVLSELEGVPQKEIAERLGMNYVTVRSKVQRGRKKLKGIFSDCCTIIQGGKGSILDYDLNKGCTTGENCS